MAHEMLTYSKAPLRQIKALQFGVIAPEQLRSMSALEPVERNGRRIEPGVNTPDTTDYVTGEPIIGGLSDPRLGSLDDPNSPGYFGHIELAVPVFQLGFLNVVLDCLRCVSYHTHTLLVDPKSISKEILRFKGRKRLIEMRKLCEKQPTDLKGGIQPKYRREGLKIIIDWSKTAAARKRRQREGADEVLDDGEDLTDAMMTDNEQGKMPLRASLALQILQGLSDEECELLGFNPKYARPDWMIVKVLPVPPPHVRPSVSMGTGRSEDDLTHLLAEIVKTNNSIKAELARSSAQHIIDDKVAILQTHVATFVDNGTPYIERATQKGGKPLKTLRQRLVGKTGRVRGNLMGKRCDFTARSVITADPNLSIDQLGVPRTVALKLTVPERVTVFNRERLRHLVRQGPDEHPGALYVIKDGMRIDLRYNHRELALREGDVVERHISNDDVVLFNRQPSLHKMSFMGHRVRVLPWSTFRLNLSCTTPYNADFDGDEMNMHVPQNIMARTEAESMMMVNKVIVSPQANRPVMGIVQDALLSSSIMTRRDVFIGKEVLMNMLTWVEGFNGDIPIPAVMVPVPNRPGERDCRWTGKQAFSLVIPNKINMNHTRSNGHNGGEKFTDLFPFDTWVIIEEGELLSGMLDKKTLGNVPGGLIQVVCNECGPEAARMLFNQIQKITNYYILQRTYTVGVGDTVATKKVMDQVQAVLDEMRRKVTELVVRGQNGQLQMQPGKTIVEVFEVYVNEVLNKARDDAGKKAEASIAPSNGFKGTVQAGSKGSFLNIAQIMTLVGQQSVDGKRIPYGFDRRTLPHFSKDDLGVESRGFVENSYLKGLTPQEFFFHAMGGRIGLIDTACKTAETGYIQRRLVKALEDLSVRYDGTVRNGRNEIVQFLYGEDGMDAAYIEQVSLDLLPLTRSQRSERFRFDVDAPDFGVFRNNNYLEYQVIEAVRRDAEARKILDEEAKQLEEDAQKLRVITYKREPNGAAFEEKNIYLPVNIGRLLLNAKKKWKMDESKPSDLRPDKVVLAVRALQKRLVVVVGDDALSKEAQSNATLLFFIYLRSSLASKPLLRDQRLCADAFNWLLEEIESRYNQAIVAPGEMCGVLAAQSIGEPTTQMTLNTFHQAGVAKKDVTAGVPRLKEIINVSKNLKTPSLTVFLDQATRGDNALATSVMNDIEFTTLRALTNLVEIVYDPFPDNNAAINNGEFTRVLEDAEWVKAGYGFYDEMLNGKFDPSALGSFVLRIKIDGKLLRFKKMSLKEISRKARDHFSGKEGLEVLHSEDTELEPVIRVRLKKLSDHGGDKMEVDLFDDGELEERKLLAIQVALLDDVVLRGIRNIPKVFIRENLYSEWNDVTGFPPKKSKEWVLDTEGTNLRDVLSVEGVDHRRTVTNDILETLEVLGIEATRRAIFNEIRTVLLEGSYVNYRHLALLVDIMTSKGFIMAITRHGVNRAESGALMRASFEETVEILMEAAAFGEYDPLGGVSENVAMGKLAPVGSGACGLLLDEDMLAKHALEHTFVEDTDEATMGVDNGQETLGMSASTPGYATPGYSGAYGGDISGSFSPTAAPGSPGAMYGTSRSPGGAMSPSYGGFSPSYSGQASPAYSPSSPAYSPSSPAYGGGANPASPAAYNKSSPSYSPSSPAYSPSSPSYGGGGAGNNKSSPAYSPSSPQYSPSSPSYGAAGAGNNKSSPSYSPSSPQYSPSSPSYGAGANTASSPRYSPSSPQYSPTSPQYSPTSPQYSPTSPQYSPTSPQYSPSSPSYGPGTTGNGYQPKKN